MYPHSLTVINVVIWVNKLHKVQCDLSVFPQMRYNLYAVVFFGVIFLVKPFSITGLVTMFITCQPTQSKELRESSSRNSDSPCRLICQPCEPSGQGLVMWFRWVSHAGVSLPSPLSASATVPHYTLCHRQPYHQRAWQFLTLGHPVCLRARMVERNDEGIGKERVYRIRNDRNGIPFQFTL